jgi:TolB-like protein/Tfp pilus assembly protein PilF
MSTEVSNEIKLELAHVLFIHVVEYSKLLINEQRTLLDKLNQIVRNTGPFREAEGAGRLKTIPTRNGMALVFYTSVKAPVECALEIARAGIEHAELKLRMGIHSGLVSGVLDVNERENVTGTGINIAQRVMDCGDAGHILISKRVAEDVEQYGDLQPYLHDLGEIEVKHGVRVHLVNLYTNELGNRKTPEKFKDTSGAAVVSPTSRSLSRRYLVVAGVVIAAVSLGLLMFQMIGTDRRAAVPKSTENNRRFGIESPAIPEKSIAVLPFENLSSDKENAYFADGIQDEILTRLSKIADLKVISRTSTQHYKSAPENLPEIARQLGVAHILEGSVQKSRDAVRVNVQLIKAATDSHLWADIFDRKLTDIFSVESEVAKAIADQLRAKLTGQEEQVIAAKPTDNLEAYDAYLRGLAYRLKSGNTPANSLGAQKYLKEAVRLDPRFGLSWALLSYVDARGFLTQNLQPTIALREEARQAAETAVTVEPNLGEAVLAKGYYHYSCLKDYDTAVRYFEQARPLLPNSSRVPEFLAYVTRRQGQWDRSESYFNQAERQDPRNAHVLTQHALSYVCLRRFPDATRKLDHVLDITPDDVDTLAQKAAVAQAEGDLGQASALLAVLHIPTEDISAWERQTYQSILEGHPAQIVPQLQAILNKQNPARGYQIGELRFWLGWARELSGDHAAAHETWQEARKELEALLNEQPQNYRLIGNLALINMGLGDKNAALAFAEQAVAANPMEKDAFAGPGPVEILARVAAGTGEVDRAIAAVQTLMVTPYESPLASNPPLTSALLRLDPMFRPLQNDRRFQKLVALPASKTR